MPQDMQREVFPDQTSQSLFISSQRTSFVHSTPYVRDYQTSGSTLTVITEAQPTIPQKTGSIFLSSSNFDLDIVALLENSFSNMMIIRETEDFIRQIGKLHFDVESFLRRSMQLVPYVDHIIKTVHDRITITGGLPFRVNLNYWIDIEVPNTECLEVEVRIAVRDYEVLLGIWESIGKEVYKQLPAEISEKLILTFDLL